MADCKDYGFMTRALHAGWDCDPATGALGLPIYATAAYQFHDGAHAERLFNLEEEGFTYSRIANPTVKAFEDTLASLESGIGAVALASGQAALSHIAAALCEAGTNVVLSRKVYGGTLTFLQNLLTRFGVEVIMVDGDHPCQVEQAINDETRAIFTETIGNPIINVAPLEALSRIARRQGVPLVVDNTFASPALCRPIEWGAHIVFHSTTKYISGFGNLVGGAVIDGGNFDWAAYPDKFPGLAKPDAGYHGVTFTERFGRAAFAAKLRASILRDLGGCPSAFDAYLLRMSLGTLGLRMKRHSENAMEVATFLENHPQVEWVRYPGLASHPQNDMAKVYLKDGCGGMMAVEVKGGVAAGRRFVDALEMIHHAANLGESRTLVTHPASTTHSQLAPEQRRAAGISDGMLRLSVGIEDARDIIADLERGLAAAAR